MSRKFQEPSRCYLITRRKADLPQVVPLDTHKNSNSITILIYLKDLVSSEANVVVNTVRSLIQEKWHVVRGVPVREKD